MSRPDWDEYFLGIAEAVAARASCPRAQIGAVIVDEDHHIIGAGYNGAPPGESHCIDVGCKMVNGHCKRAVHADMNALNHSDHVPLGCTIYISGGPPCVDCACELLHRHVRRVVFRGDYGLVVGGITILRQNGCSVLELVKVMP